MKKDIGQELLKEDEDHGHLREEERATPTEMKVEPIKEATDMKEKGKIDIDENRITMSVQDTIEMIDIEIMIIEIGEIEMKEITRDLTKDQTTID